MELHKLSNFALSELLQNATSEASRRTICSTEGNDTAKAILSNEHAKRAATVAIAGNHSILFYGASKSGKTMLRALCLELELYVSFEASCCPCGNYNDPRAVCKCAAKQIGKYRASWPIVDISVEVVRPTARDQLSKHRGTGVVEIRAAIAQQLNTTDLTLCDTSQRLAKACIGELGINPAQWQRILAVARTIANLDMSERILPTHLSEAINYRPPARA
jgi:predicted ATPase with chaperone activity